MAERYATARDSGAPLVGGHRGNSAELPENTIAAFESAIALGVDMIECDVHLSSDGQLVVIHDHGLERTTNGTGLVIQHTLDELRALDAGRGEHLPTLAEVCEVARDRVGLCVELKQVPLPYPALEEKLIEALRALDMVEQTCVISFSHPAVLRVKQLEPRLQAGAIVGARPVKPVDLLRASGADIYAPQWGMMDPELVRELHDAGNVVGAWTVDDGLGVAWCQQCRPDSVFTNRPREILPQLRS